MSDLSDISPVNTSDLPADHSLCKCDDFFNIIIYFYFIFLVDIFFVFIIIYFTMQM